jgi:hypothetical protein
VRSDRRDIARRVLVYAAALVFAAALVHRFHWLGGPYFTIPETIQDHVWPVRFKSADAILLCRRAEPMLRRDATITVLAPSEAPNYDQTHWLTALGLLVHQHPIPQKLEARPDYVITIGEPLSNAEYRQVAQFPEGFLYELRR